MRVRRYVIVSIILSIVLHLLLLKATQGVTVTRRTWDMPVTVSTQLHEIEPMQELPTPETTLPDLPSADGQEKPDIASLQQDIQPRLEQNIEKILEQANLTNKPEVTYRLDGLELQRSQAPVPVPDEQPVMATAPRPKLVEIKMDSLPPARQELDRPLAPALDREDISQLMLPSLAQPGPLTAATGGSFGLTVKMGSRPTFGGPDFDIPELKLPTGADGSLPPALTLPTPELALPEIKGSQQEKSVIPKPFDQYVDIQVLTLPEENGSGGYFLVLISPNRSSDALEDIPKDSLFLIDHSASISPAKLTQFKKAASDSLACLNAEDRFNIVSFTSSANKLFPEFTGVTAKTRSQAQDYIGHLIRGGMTDVFGCISPLVKNSNGNASRPLNIFLLTDGQSTVNIHSDDDFLRQIYGQNPGNVSIFPFSVGPQANRQLLDFLGYLNRGAKCHVDKLPDLAPQLVNFISAHTSLLIRDLKYTVDADTGRDLFPRQLPHLYRRETLKLYGRYSNAQTELVISLTGIDASGARRSLVFRKPFADCPPADKTLAAEWAGQKILYLIALKTWTEDKVTRDAYDREIRRLTAKYQVYAPY